MNVFLSCLEKGKVFRKTFLKAGNGMDKELIMKYAPYIYFDKNEPFFPVRVGCTIFETPGYSVSFRRNIDFDPQQVRFAIEYAIYWHYDIGHLYDLEHIWIFVATDGSIADCEASFHGNYLKGLLKDRSNIEDGTHVRLYSQPGKHAFSPMAEVFELLPNLMTDTYDCAGVDGLLVTGVARGRYGTNEEIDDMVREYLKSFSFVPTMEFFKYVIPKDIITTWDNLDDEIPDLIYQKLEEIRIWADSQNKG